MALKFPARTREQNPGDFQDEIMKRRKQQKASKQQTDLDKWLAACDEMLSGMIESAGPDWETRRALGEVFVNKAFVVLKQRWEVTLH